MIKIEGVSKSYGNGAPALSNLNLEIEEGEFVFVVGASLSVWLPGRPLWPVLSGGF